MPSRPRYLFLRLNMLYALPVIDEESTEEQSKQMAMANDSHTNVVSLYMVRDVIRRDVRSGPISQFNRGRRRRCRCPL